MNEELLYQVILAPHVSEKASRVADKNRQFVFTVRRDATKPLIKERACCGRGLFERHARPQARPRLYENVTIKGPSALEAPKNKTGVRPAETEAV